MEEKKEAKGEDHKEGAEEGRDTFRSDYALIATVIIIILIIAGTVLWIKFFSKPVVAETIDDLHRLNLEGKLKPERGYVYGGYSFVYTDGLWYTQIQTKQGEVVFDIPHHYGPRDLEDVKISGYFNSSLFSSNKEIYITFNPLGRDENFKFITVAIGEFDQPIIKTFGKRPVAACDKETDVCLGRPIVSCENESLPVLYIQEGEEEVILDGNCLVVKGNGLGIIRAMDRLLMYLYGIM